MVIFQLFLVFFSFFLTCFEINDNVAFLCFYDTVWSVEFLFSILQSDEDFSFIDDFFLVSTEIRSVFFII